MIKVFAKSSYECEEYTMFQRREDMVKGILYILFKILWLVAVGGLLWLFHLSVCS